jgi:lipopolysaccharide/colanic/teichoic acid biosynthesis glycosyltransferase
MFILSATDMDWKVRIAKRALDVASSAVGLMMTLPVMPVIAAAIYIESPGPVIFRQKRAGQLLGVSKKNGAPEFQFVEFEMFKFRSMRVDAEKYTGAVLASENDPRVTKVGKFLRKSRLDELPQLVNVLLGDMSLVGPRPERPELLSNLALAIPFFEERMRDVKPGITGLAQVSLGYTGRALEGTAVAELEKELTNPWDLDGTEGSTADDMRMKLLFDVAYGATLDDFKQFIITELTVILKTPWVMVRGVGR